MTIDIDRAYEAGRRAGKGEGHNTPSSETLKMIGDLKAEISSNKTSMQDLKEVVERRFNQNSEEHKEMMESFKEAMEEKANKYIEKVVIWGGGIVILTMISMLGFLIKIVLFNKL
jgi:hypothetical protein